MNCESDAIGNILFKNQRNFCRECAFAIFIACGLGNADAHSRQTASDVELIEPGWQHVSISGKAGWLGLYSPRAKRNYLRSCKVKAGPEKSEDSQGAGARQITVQPSRDLVFAVRGLRCLSPRRVVTIDDAYKSFRMRGLRFHLTSVYSISSDSGEITRVVLRCGPRTQVVAEVQRRFPAVPAWVGDLDGDGKPDIYIEREMNGGLETSQLFLSSYAKKGELVGLAAEYHVRWDQSE